jgi:hypothetical protein
VNLLNWWPIALALLGAQGLLAAFSAVVLCMPLTNAFARRMHRKRGLLLALGTMAAVVPLLYFGLHSVDRGYGEFFARYMGASLAAVLFQVLLYSAEDRRVGPASRGPDSRLDPPRSPVR